MNNFDNYVYCLLEDISRRGFLKGALAAATGLGATAAIASNPLPRLSGLPWKVAARKSIIHHEGKRSEVYLDSKKIPSIGVGFNLNRADARQVIKSIGGDYDALIAKRAQLTPDQMTQLFNINYKEAEQDARRLVRNFDLQPDFMKVVLIDMAFNLGYNKLRGFENFLPAVIRGDYKRAAKEMVDSDWYHQVKDRSKNLVKIVNNQSL